MSQSIKYSTFLVVFLTMLSFGYVWKDGIQHWQGDALLSAQFFHAGDYFASFGLKSYGLAVYGPDIPVYTHLTAGPEWIQWPIALIRRAMFPTVDMFRWHSVVTAILSLLLTFIGFNLVKKLALIVLQLDSLKVDDEKLKIIFDLTLILLLTTTSILIYSLHPYCLGGISSDVLMLSVCYYWCKEPTHKRSITAVSLMVFSVFYAFWMGISPVTSTFFIFLLFLYFFGAQEFRKKRIVQFIIISAIALMIAVGLKLFQNYLYFKTWNNVYLDAMDILKKRQGLIEYGSYSFSLHILKIIWRYLYLFGAVGILLMWLIGLTRKTEFRKVWRFTIFLLVAGISWQIFMRHHGFHHNYMQRLELFPVLLAFMMMLVIAVYEKRLELDKFIKISKLAVVVQLVAIWVLVIKPLI